MMYWAILIFMLITLVFIIEGIVNVIPYNHSEMVSNAGLHCNSNFKPNGTYNRNSSLEILYALGFVYGCLGVSKHLSIYWVVTSWWKRILRYLVCIGVSYGTIFLFELIDTSDSYDDSLLHYALPNFLIGYVFSGVLPYVFIKCGLAPNMKPHVDKEEKLEKLNNKIII